MRATATRAQHLAVRGVPQPKGSKRAFAVKGRPIIVDVGGKNLRQWEQTIRWVAQEHWEGPPLDGPVRVGICFTFSRPKSAPKRNPPTWVSVRPDLDKLVRGCLDALTGVAFKDDGQIAELYAKKEYGDQPGASIRIEPL